MIKQMDISDENRERIKALINQVADLSVDESIIDKGMEETFDMRREWISSKVPAIRTIYEVFPAFILEEIVNFNIFSTNFCLPDCSAVFTFLCFRVEIYS